MNQIQNWLHNSLVFSLILLASTPTSAQINADDTLGAESSSVTPNVLINGASADRIDGGALRGSNLFHSFTQFNIDDGQRVYFGNPAGVQNIFTRVTGRQSSNILGTLGVAGNANLFLINPNGIVFGKNAQLDIRGAFTATTANSLLFPNGIEFSATNTQAPPLLTINVPIGLQFGSQPGSITSQAVNPLYVGTGSTLAFMGGEIALDGSFLFGSNGQVKLAAVGGDTSVGLNVNGSSLDFKLPENFGRSPINLTNSRIVATGENSGIEIFGEKISLNGNSSYLFSSNGGSIVVDATQLNLDNSGGIASATNGAAKGGDIQIQASDAVNLTNSSAIFSNSNASGKGGDITINADKITITGDGIPATSSRIYTSAIGEGNGGNLTLNAKESVNINGGFVLLISGGIGNTGNLTVRATDAINISNQSSLALSSLGSGSTGDIRIETGTLRVKNNFSGRGITALASDGGSVGSISIQARNGVEVSQSNIATSLVLPFGSITQAKAGDITIETQRVSLKDGGNINTNTSSSANAANILIKASEYVEINGVSSGVSSRTSFGTGNSGNVTIETPRLNITQGANITTTSISSSGNAGNITIRAQDVELDGFVFLTKEQVAELNELFSTEEFLFDPQLQEVLSQFGGLNYTSDIISDVINSNADVLGGTIAIDTERLRLSNGASISTSVVGGRGRGGNLVVRATDTIDISGVGPKRQDGSPAPSGLFAELQTGGIGSGGSINLTTGRLNLSNGGQISASTFNQGNAGNVFIDANQIDLRGQQTVILTVVDDEAKGDAGNINIKTQQLNLQGGAQISSGTQGNGNGGNLKVQADTINLTGSVDDQASSLTTSVDERANGKGGDIDVTSNRIFISDDAEIASGSLGTGDAGNMRISTNFLAIDGKGSAIASLTNAGNGGDIILEIGELLLLRRGALISTTAGRTQAGGNGGNIILNSPFIAAIPNENSDITANAFTGKGGNVNITTQGIFGIQARSQLTPQSDITASSELGVQGEITITEPQLQPPQKLLELPTGLVDASSQIAQTCPRGPNAKPLGKFVVTGRGSLPPSSLEPLTGATSLNPLASLDGENPDTGMQGHQDTGKIPQIVEAQGFIKTADGKIALVAQAPIATPSATKATAACVAPR
ncbi:two-partner secretion domain-containing protein [Calothrix sp. NIES-2098]|uniref:two-partner secretion domain-containing protein n=1 Tax=Calothrix sp. NIES-2098 TaxID=1954171 RepID=UPI000B61E18D|nr:filamentous hemagglutinin outer membrane protein [Calothrix sp. NIES-2098]